MRLLQTEGDGHFSLVEFIGQDIPPYAILSHTWGADNEEVTFQDLVNGTGQQKKGYNKIRFCGKQATEDCLKYFWVDTCCSKLKALLWLLWSNYHVFSESSIWHKVLFLPSPEPQLIVLSTLKVDKSSSAELTESINSMFTWYQEATVCYVLLEDLPPDISPADGLQHCRWFTRGWTLQELLAPKSMEFFDGECNYIGTKEDFVDVIAVYTNISVEVLRSPNLIQRTSVATRMSWAAHRRTKRIEDIAYSLLGIFDVNMPLIYGEGMKAFRRLQEEIIKRNNDLTIFAWENLSITRKPFMGLFAPSPAFFAVSSRIVPLSHYFAEFSVTNKGLLLAGDTPLYTVIGEVNFDHRTRHLYLVLLGASRADGHGYNVGIYLRKVGPQLFCRIGDTPLAALESIAELCSVSEGTKSYILLNPSDAHIAQRKYRDDAITVPSSDSLMLDDAIPNTLWDHTDSLFLQQKRLIWAADPVVLVIALSLIRTNEVPLTLVVLYRRNGPGSGLMVFNRWECPRMLATIFQGRYQEEGITWSELESQAPDVRTLSDSTPTSPGSAYRVSVGFSQSLPYVYGETRRTLHFWVTGPGGVRQQFGAVSQGS